MVHASVSSVHSRQPWCGANRPMSLGRWNRELMGERYGRSKPYEFIWISIVWGMKIHYPNYSKWNGPSFWLVHQKKPSREPRDIPMNSCLHKHRASLKILMDFPRLCNFQRLAVAKTLQTSRNLALRKLWRKSLQCPWCSPSTNVKAGCSRGVMATTSMDRFLNENQMKMILKCCKGSFFVLASISRTSSLQA